jgi:hypothetical protein
MINDSEVKKKTVLSICHSGGRGKTESVRQFAISLLSAYPVRTEIIPIPAIIPIKGDFRIIVKINGIIIGIESQGDPNSRLKIKLNELADVYKCDIIVCTSRTRGETIVAVDSLKPKGFEIIRTSTYQTDEKLQQNIVNTTKGKHILELLQVLGKI